MQATLRYKVLAIWRGCMYTHTRARAHTYTHKAFTLLQINFPLGYTTFHVKAGGFCYPTLFSVKQ